MQDQLNTVYHRWLFSRVPTAFQVRPNVRPCRRLSNVKARCYGAGTTTAPLASAWTWRQAALRKQRPVHQTGPGRMFSEDQMPKSADYSMVVVYARRIIAISWQAHIAVQCNQYNMQEGKMFGLAGRANVPL